MTARVDPRQEPFDLLFVERALESYADTTRIVASDQFRNRVRIRLAEEPRPTPWLRAWYSLRTLVRAAFGRDAVTVTARLHALVLLLVGALVLSLAVGGAGAVVVSRCPDRRRTTGSRPNTTWSCRCRSTPAGRPHLDPR